MFHHRRRTSKLLVTSILLVLIGSFLPSAHAGIIIAQLAASTNGPNVFDSLGGAFGDCVTATSAGNLADVSVSLIASPVSTNASARISAAVYSATGTPGSSCAPSSSPIGRTNAIPLTTLTTSLQNFLFTFAGTQQAPVANGQVLFVAILSDQFGGSQISVGAPTSSSGPSNQNRETCATAGNTEIFDGNADIINPAVNCGLIYACNTNNCNLYTLDGTVSQSGPGSTVTANQVCITCTTPTPPPIDVPTPIVLQQIQPVLSTTATIDSRPFIIIAILFFLITLFPYLIYHKKSNLSKQYEIRV